MDQDLKVLGKALMSAGLIVIAMFCKNPETQFWWYLSPILIWIEW